MSCFTPALILDGLDEGVVRVELDDTLFDNAVSEVTAVEVGLEAADANDEFRRPYLFLDLRARNRPNVDLQT